MRFALTALVACALLFQANGGQESTKRAPDVFRVQVPTTKGTMLWEFHRDWSPQGVDHFYELLRSGYYDNSPFFRVVAGRWAQFGINNDPKISSAWRAKPIPDDPRVESNVRGTIAFAFAVPNGRTTQIFINLKDNRPTHDKEPFVPIGRVVEGMDIADALYSGYGEKSGGGIRAGKQAALFETGGAYLKDNYPLLDWMQKLTVVEAEGTAKASAPAVKPGVFLEEGFKVSPPLTRLFALDAYTEYDLLDDVNSSSFRIVFMPLETKPGSTHLINETRHGSDGGGIEVYDPRTGKPLKFEYLPGAEMVARKILGKFSPEDHYIWAELPNPVPAGGEGRVLIYKTYKDPRTYYPEGEDIVWTRPLSAQRFGIVLPKGYSFISSNIASQIMTTADGRLKLSLTNPSGGGSPITIRAHKTTATFLSQGDRDKIADDGKTLYDLGAAESHSFTVEQTYSESHRGKLAKLSIKEYIPKISGLKAVDLDTAQPLEMKGGLVRLPVEIVNERQSAHLKVSGTVKDNAYRVEGDGLLFQLTLHGPRNTILLPMEWDVTHVSQPATVGRYQGRVFIAVVNIQENDGLPITVRARKKS